MQINKEKFNWYGFDHEEVRKHYGDLDGNLQYVGTFCVKDHYTPAAVYHAPNPDKSKGHKNFVLFYKDPVLMTFMVTGMTIGEMLPYVNQLGIQCPACAEVIYSVMRHDYRRCMCEESFVDGGRDYLRANIGSISVNIELLSGIATLA